MDDGQARYEDHIEALLRDGPYRYERDGNLGGLRFDFVVHAPADGSYVVLEVKHLASGVLDARYLKLARMQMEAARARRALIVSNARTTADAHVISSVGSVQVVRDDQLLAALAQEFSRTTQVHGFAGAAVIALPQVFAAMPFAEEFDDVFVIGIAGAAERTRTTAYRVDHDNYSGDVVAKIKEEIRRSAVMVADLTRQRPNVLYEMGFAHALDKPVVPICSDDQSTVPFDVSHENILKYGQGQTARLRDALADRLKAHVGSR